MRDSPILTRRMLALRQFPMFTHADLGELATVAENVVERGFGSGDLVAPADHLASLHLVVHGSLQVGEARVEARQVHGALEIAADRPARDAAIAIAATRTLMFDASDYFEVLEDNFGLLLATIRDLAARVSPLEVPVRPPVHFQSSSLGLVERMILLRQLPPFEAARLEALAILAHAATEARWPAGVTIRRIDAPADSVVIVADGELVGGARAIGLYEALAGLHHRATVESLTPIRALVTQASTIHDVLEDHTDLALGMMQILARTLVDHADPRSVCADCPSHSWRAS